MRIRSFLPLVLAVTIGLLYGCGQRFAQLPSDSVPTPDQPSTSDPPLVGPPGPGTPLTACRALYDQPPAQPVVEEDLPYGQVATLILSFAQDAVKARAINWMETHLSLRLGQNLGSFENLPMVAAHLPVTREVVEGLVQGLAPLGLLSIYADRQLEYFLKESSPFIGAPQAREAFGVTGKGVGVGVLDSGIDGLHQDFDPRVNLGRNVKLVGSVLESPLGGVLWMDLPNTDTTSGHGTHVASTIAGLGRASLNQNKYIGIAPEATLVGVGAGDALFILYALQGFDFLLRPEIRERYNLRIISNSWGSSGRFAPYHPISLATKRAYDLGIVVVFAAGNSGPNPDTLNPYSASPCAISVAAGDKSGNLARFSSRGIPGDPFHHPDITTPGVNIVAARASTCSLCALDTRTPTGDPQNALFYTTMSGTSMATPHVSGTIALMLEANPGLTLEDILAIFQDTARKMYDQDGREMDLWEVGYGYLDAYAAVQEAVRRNPSRFVLETIPLETWTGTVQPAVCLIDCVVNARHEKEIQVPSGLSALRVRVSWGNPLYDLDLYVYDPDGNLAASSTQGVSVSEEVAVPNPRPGTWKAEVRGYLNLTTTYQGQAEGERLNRRP